MNINSYTVSWTIEIDATSPEVAAQMAKEIQQDEESTANIFVVINDKTKEKSVIDLVL